MSQRNRAIELLKSDQPITSGPLAKASFLENKSTNTGGFLLAALLHEGLVNVTEGKDRQYEMVGQKEYEKIILGYTKKAGKKTKGAK